MKRRDGIVGLMIMASLALSVPVFAPGGGGQGKGQAIQKQSGSMNQNQKRQRLRDGSCNQTRTPQGAKNKSENTYGPGDATGNQGAGPKDGTGYGAPANQQSLLEWRQVEILFALPLLIFLSLPATNHQLLEG